MFNLKSAACENVEGALIHLLIEALGSIGEVFKCVLSKYTPQHSQNRAISHSHAKQPTYVTNWMLIVSLEAVSVMRGAFLQRRP